MPLKVPANAAPVTGLLKVGAPVLTHTLRGTLKRLQVNEGGDEIQYLVAYTDPATDEAHERWFRADELFVPAAQGDAA